MSNTLKGDVLIIISTLLACLGWFFSKEVLSSMSPLQFISLRFTCVGLILLLFCWRAFSVIKRQTFYLLSPQVYFFATGVTIWVSLPIVLFGLGCLFLENEFNVGFGEFLFMIAAVVRLCAVFHIKWSAIKTVCNVSAGHQPNIDHRFLRTRCILIC